MLGLIRMFLVVPHIGMHMAELLETPIIIVVMVLAAWLVVKHLAVSKAAADRLSMGYIALVLMLACEFILGLWLRGLSIERYLATRDPVTSTVYYLSLVPLTLSL